MSVGVSDLLIRVQTDTAGAVSGLSGLSLGLIGLGVSAAAASVQFVKMGIDAQDQLAIVQGLTGASKSQMAQYVSGLEGMATELGFTMAEGAQGLYYVVSAGFSGANALTVLKVAAEGALASGASLRDVSNGLTSAMNAYGAKAQDAAHYSDIMTTAVTYGKQTFADFADNVGKAALMAATSHVPFDQLAAAESALTEKGLPAANAMTYLRYMFSKITIDIPALQKAVEKAGGTFDATKYQGLDLAQKLLYLQNQTGLTEGQFVTLTGGARGSQAALGLVGDQGVAFEKILAKMGDSAGLTASAFAVHDATITGGFEDIKAALSITAYEVANFATSFLQPPFTNITDAIASVNTKFIEMEPTLRDTLTSVLGLAVGVGQMVGHFLDLASWLVTDATGIGILKSALITFGAVMAGIKVLEFVQALMLMPSVSVTLFSTFAQMAAGLITLSVGIDASTTSIWALNASILGLEALTFPVWALVAAVVAVVAAIAGLVYWFTSTQSGMQAWSDITHAVGQAMSALGTVVQSDVVPILKDLGVVLVQVGGWLKTQFLDLVQYLTPTFEQASVEVKKFVDNMVTELGPIIQMLERDLPGAIQAFQKVWSLAWPIIGLAVEAVWNNIRVVTETAWGIIEGIVMIYWSLISGGLTIGMDLLTGKWGKAWGDFKGMLSGIWAGIEQVFGSFLGGLVSLTLDHIGTIATLLSKIPGPVGDMASAILNEIKDLRSNVTTEYNTLATNTTQAATDMSTGTTAAVTTMHGRVAAQTQGMSTDVTTATSNMKTLSIKHSQDMGATIQTTLQNTWNAVTKDVGNFFSGVGTTASGAWATVSASVGTFFSNLGNAFTKGTADAGKTFGDFFSGLGTWLINHEKDFEKSWSDWWNNRRDDWDTGLTNLNNDWTDFWAPTGNFFSELGKANQTSNDQMGKNFSQLGDTMNKAWSEFVVSPWGKQLKSMSDAIDGTVQSWIDSIEAGIVSVTQKVNAWGNSVEGAITKWTTDTTNTINAWGNTQETRFSSMITNVTNTVNTWGNNVEDNIAKWTTDTTNKINAWGNTQESRFSSMVLNTTNTVNNWGNNIEAGITKWITTTTNTINAWGNTQESRFNTLTTNTTRSVNNWGQGIENSITNWVQQTTANINNWGNQQYAKVNSTLGSIGSAVSVFFANQGKEWGAGWNYVNVETNGALNTMWGGIQTFLSNTVKSIQQWTNSVNQAGSQLGDNIAHGVASGIGGAWNWFLGQLHNYFGDGNSRANDGSMVGYIKGLLGIHSPSTVFAGMGQQMLQGLINGFSGHNLKNSIGGFISSSLGGIGNVIGAMVRSNIIDLSQIPVTGWNYLKSIGGDVFSMLQGMFGSSGGGGGGVGSTAGVNIGGNVVQWLMQAMADTGVPESWLTGLEIIAQHESGGNPNAVNRTDSNWLAGHPSMGLMQTIMGTFMKYTLPGMTQIFNPIDNAVAAIRYIESVYGGIQNVPGVRAVGSGHPYVGYALGGWINEPIVGMGRSGTRYAFGEAGPEYVSPGRQSGSEGKTYHFENHFHGSNLTVKDVVREQAWQARLHGGG